MQYPVIYVSVYNDNYVQFDRKVEPGIYLEKEFQATPASLDRLHRTATKMVRDGEAGISLYWGGYEVTR